MLIGSKLSKDRLDSLQVLAETTRYLDGVVAEVGTCEGGTTKLLGRMFPEKRVMGFDTFEGLPAEHWSEGEPEIGKFAATIEDALRLIAQCHVELVKGLFPASCDPSLTFSFVHLDVDYYLATLLSLQFIWPRMVTGGIILLDDYEWPECPGVKQALHEFAVAHLVPIHISPITYGDGIDVVHQAFLVKR